MDVYVEIVQTLKCATSPELLHILVAMVLSSCDCYKTHLKVQKAVTALGSFTLKLVDPALHFIRL